LGTNDRVAYALFPPGAHCIETKKQATERKQLHERFTETKLYAKVTEQVRKFIEEQFSRPAETKNDAPTTVFDSLFAGGPTQSFVNLYEAGRKAGMAEHRDSSSFCTAIVCLAGDSSSDQSLVLGEASTGSAQQTALKAGDLLIFKRLYHTVPDCVRAADRITINMFF
jgi:hypothetical protein